MAIDPNKKSKVLSYRWLIFVVLAIAYFFVYFHRTTGGSISSTLQEAFGVGAAEVALLASAYLYAYTLMQIPSGILTDKMGPRQAASAFIIILAIGSLMCAFAEPMDNFNMMIAGKFIIGIGAADGTYVRNATGMPIPDFGVDGRISQIGKPNENVALQDYLNFIKVYMLSAVKALG